MSNNEWLQVTLLQLKSKPTTKCVTWPFTINNCGYGVVRTERGTQSVHRQALAFKLGRKVKSNLQAAHSCKGNRACYNPDHLSEKTAKQNTSDKLKDGTSNKHTGLISSNTSGYKGVNQTKSGKWMSRIEVFGKRMYLGVYDTREEAARVYDIGQLKYWGTGFRLNFPDSELKGIQLPLRTELKMVIQKQLKQIDALTLYKESYQAYD